MASINFYLNRAISAKNMKVLQVHDPQELKYLLEKTNQIYISVSTKGVRFKVYTKKRIQQKFWDLKKQNVDLKKNANLQQLKDWLIELRSATEKLAEAKELRAQRITHPDVSTMIERMNLGKSTHATFDDYFNQFIAEHKTTEGHTPRPNTLKKYHGFLKHLKAYSKKTKFHLEIANFDLGFLFAFKNYLVEDLGLADNSVSKYTKTAKTFIRFFMRKGMLPYYDMAQVVTKEREGEIYVLAYQELVDLQDMQIDNGRLDRARDLFCFMCWTGQRSSDYYKIKRDDIQPSLSGQLVWELITQKKQRKVVVPITEFAKKILDKYRLHISPVPTLSNHVLNRYLKELGQLAGLDRKVKRVKYHDGVMTETHVPFYEVLTTHVARKSYITNSLALGVKERTVRDISDHQDEKSFRRYVNLSDSYKTSMIMKAFSRENIEKHMKEMGWSTLNKVD